MKRGTKVKKKFFEVMCLKMTSSLLKTLMHCKEVPRKVTCAENTRHEEHNSSNTFRK